MSNWQRIGNKSCPQCYGRGYIGWAVLPDGNRERVPCPKCTRKKTGKTLGGNHKLKIVADGKGKR